MKAKLLGWGKQKGADHGYPKLAKQSKTPSGVKSSVESKGVTQHKFLKKNDSNNMELEMNWGFDLTDFKPNGFQTVLKELGIKDKPTKTFFKVWSSGDDDNYKERRDQRGFVWKKSGLEIETHNNPITGEFSGKIFPREPMKDYAGYIGISGDPEKVAMAVKLIKENTTYIKGESPEEREFI